MCEVKNQSLPSSAVLGCFAPSSYPPEKFVCQTQQHLNLTLGQCTVSKKTNKKWEKYHLIETGCLFLAVYNHMLSVVQCEGFISAFPALQNLYLFAVIAMMVRKAGTEK